MPKSLAGKLSICFTLLAFALPILLFFYYSSTFSPNPSDYIGASYLAPTLIIFFIGSLLAILGFISGLFAFIKTKDQSIGVLISIIFSGLPTLYFLWFFIVRWFH